MEFNKLVHQADEHGDPVRNDDGGIRLKTNWRDAARDRQGRSYNPRVHGTDEKLDEEGFLSVRRRADDRTPMTGTNRTEAFVDKHREPGYAYYVMADDPGRQGQFESHDYEPVMDENGPATLSGGQGRTSDTKMKLMKKPQEWYDEDQRAKDALQRKNLEDQTKPNEDEGQYEANPTSPLR